MKWTEQFAEWLRPSTPTRDSPLRDAVMAGRTAKFSEDYAAALNYFDQALEAARKNAALIEPSAVTVIAMHRAETLTRLRRFDDAATFIAAMRASPPTIGRDQHIAYMECARGVLEQAKGDTHSARIAYESALKTAKAGNVAGAEGRAMGHLADLDLRDGNANYAAHALREALPKLGASSDIELSTFFVGLLGQAMTMNGQESDGLQFVQRAFSLSEQFHHRLYERHWGMVLGKRALDETRYLDARTHYQRILHLFDPEKPTPAYVAVQAGLSKAATYVGDLANAISAGELAVNALPKLVDAPLDPPIPLVTKEDTPALAHGALGLALRAANRSAEALPHLQAALDASGEHITRDEIDVLRGLAAAQADTGSIHDSVSAYQRAIAAAEKLDDPLEVAQCRRDLGLIYHRHGMTTQAVHEWTAALNIYEEKTAHAQIARLYCDLGSLRRSLGQSARALKDYEQALMALNNVDSADLETRGLVLSNAAIMYAETGDAESADAFFSEAILIAERTGDTAADSTRSGNYGWFLSLVGRPRRAIASLERALRLSQIAGLSLQTAVQTDNLGLAYDSLSDYPRALDYHRKALTMIDGAAQPYWDASFKINLANTLLSLNEIDEAIPLIDQALERGRATNDPDLVIRALTAHARAAILQARPADAAIPIDEAVTLARRIESKRLLADLLYLRSQQKMMTGYDSAASAAWDEAHKLYGMLHMPQAKIQPTWLVKSGG